MNQYIVIGNYQNNIKTAYVSGWDRVINERGLPTISQVESYLCDVLDDRSYGQLLVKDAKLLARKINIRVGDATAIVVSKKSKEKIAKHFKPEIDKTLWIVEV